jgi:hypothetical protein
VRALLSLALALGLAAPLRAQTYLVVVTGLSGEPPYARAFREWASTLIGAAEHRLGMPANHITYLAESVDSAGDIVAQRSTKENLSRALAALATRVEPNATVVLVLIGHGNAMNAEPRFDLPGPDITAGDLGRQLAAFRTQRVVVVNTTSASGDWVGPLSGARRVVITATRSGTESYATQFPRFFASAFADDGADTDKDGRLTVLEAFVYAAREVAHLYETQHKLATEHPQLDDDGDGKASATPDARQGDGVVAASIFLDVPRATVAGSATPDSVLARLYATRDSLQRQLSDLRGLRAGMDSTAYNKESERLLLELARNGQAIRAREGRQE